MKYEFSSVHVEAPQTLSNEIVQWGRGNVTDDDIYVRPNEPSLGREDDIHITILYGIHAEQPDKVKTLFANHGPIHVKLGKVGVFTSPNKYDVVKIAAFSEELQKLHEKLIKNTKHTTKYSKYRPHVTIAYVKKGKGSQFENINLWENREFSCNHVVFSSKNGSKINIVI